MRITLLLFLSLFSFLLYGQEFSTHLYFYDANGNQDSVLVGFDSTATFNVDAQFLEEDISDLPFSEFDVRLAQINYDLWEPYCTNYFTLEEFQTSQSKIDILPKKCFESIDNFFALTTILIPNKNIPLTIKWDKTIFENDCVSGSSLATTVWNPPCVEIENGFLRIFFNEEDSIAIETAQGLQVVHFEGDTLSVLHLFLQDGLGGALNNQLEDSYLSVSPNPFTDEIVLAFDLPEPLPVEWSIYSLTGEQLLRSDLGKLPVGRNSFELDLTQNSLAKGLYLLQVNFGNDFVTRKLIKH